MKKIYTVLLLFISFSSFSQIVNIPDVNFKNALLATPTINTNGDSEIQVSEAEATTEMFVSNANISSLEGIQSFINLDTLVCEENNLSTIDLSQNTQLRVLWCSRNQINSLDVSQNVNLEALECWTNQLTTLDITQNTNLTRLWCFENALTALDFSQNLNLTDIECQRNQLVHLDLSLNTSLTKIYCSTNQLQTLNVKNGNNTILARMEAFSNNLNCIQVDDVDFANNAPEWQKDAGAQYSEDCTLGISDLNISTLYLYPNPASNRIHIEANATPIDAVISVYDVRGSLILNGTVDSTIDISEWSQGLYFIKVNADGQTVVRKFIKK